MEKERQSFRSPERWAHFRFSVIGPLLAAPPPRGQLQEQLQELAAKKWVHPISGEWTLFGLSTIERWYYKALGSKDGPVEVLKRKIRSDQGQHPAFTTEVNRTQRRSDGTLSLEGLRFEIPSRYGHLEKIGVRYASWDLGWVYLSDPKTGALLCRLYPQDKKKNAEGRRAPKTPAMTSPEPVSSPGMAPLLQKIIRHYATTGLPPAYLPKADHPNPS